MRVLLDENIPRKLALLFPVRVEAVTVAQQGWKGVKNGKLLALAQREFDVFVTADKGIPQQQNLERLDLVIVLLRAKSNRYEDLAPLMDGVRESLDAQPGEVRRVSG